MPTSFSVTVGKKYLGEFTCREGASPGIRNAILTTELNIDMRKPYESTAQYLFRIYPTLSELDTEFTIHTETRVADESRLRLYISELQALYPGVTITCTVHSGGFAPTSRVSITGKLLHLMPAWWWCTLAQRLCATDISDIAPTLIQGIRQSRSVMSNWHNLSDKGRASAAYKDAAQLDGIVMIVLNYGPVNIRQSSVVQEFDAMRSGSSGGVSELAQEAVLKTAGP